MSLYHIKKNNRCIIQKLPSNNLLKSLGVREGIEVSIMSKQPLGGPVVIQVGRRSIAIAKDLAKEITVKEVS